VPAVDRSWETILHIDSAAVFQYACARPGSKQPPVGLLLNRLRADQVAFLAQGAGNLAASVFTLLKAAVALGEKQRELSALLVDRLAEDGDARPLIGEIFRGPPVVTAFLQHGEVTVIDGERFLLRSEVLIMNYFHTAARYNFDFAGWFLYNKFT